ncbi:MAG: hypothetical protein COB71_13315 [Thiotrichales bacterium]|nr:MAG: hypothetical protein COB71_13315 [Thiotrichales bacterium]
MMKTLEAGSATGFMTVYAEISLRLTQYVRVFTEWKKACCWSALEFSKTTTERIGSAYRSVSKNSNFTAKRHRAQGTNIYTYQVTGKRNKSRIKGFLIEEPETVFEGVSLPAPNPHLKLAEEL